MRDAGPPTIRDLAADLGLDIATISRGLKGSPRVAAATRARIRQCADELGYRPDPTLARLARHRWAGRRRPEHLSIALLTPRRRRRDPGYVSLMPATAERMGYSLREVAIADFPDAAALQDHLLAGGMRGILFGHVPGMHGLPELEWEAFAVMECGSVGFDHPFDSVVTDTVAQMRIALEAVLAAGHRRIGVVQLPAVLATDHLRVASIEVLRRRHRLRRLPVYEVPHRIDAAARANFAAWYRRAEPQALVLPNAHIARALWPRREERPPCALLSDAGDARGFAHVRTDLPAVGRRAVEQLCQALSHGRFGIADQPAMTMIRPRWVPGGSLPAVDHRSQ